MQLILIAGQAGVGKTTLANIIARKAFELGLIPKLLSFASPLKEIAQDRGYGKKENPEKYRRFCQRIGAGKRRQDPDHWVNLFEEEMLSIRKEERKDIKKGTKYWERCIIADDCRYPNEVKLGIKYKATLIFLSYGDRGVDKVEWREHDSENMAKIIDSSGSNNLRKVFQYFIKNQGHEGEFEDKVSSLVPVWCGIQPENGTVVSDYDEHIEDITKAITDLIDLLLLGAIEEEEEDEEDPEEDYT